MATGPVSPFISIVVLSLILTTYRDSAGWNEGVRWAESLQCNIAVFPDA